jgi:hypothetical protein
MDMAGSPNELSGEHGVDADIRAYIDHGVTRMDVVTEALRDTLLTLHAPW